MKARQANAILRMALSGENPLVAGEFSSAMSESQRPVPASLAF